MWLAALRLCQRYLKPEDRRMVVNNAGKGLELVFSEHSRAHSRSLLYRRVSQSPVYRQDIGKDRL